MKTNDNLNIKSWAEQDRPREKFLLKGKASLSDAELIAILIGSGTPDMSAVELAKLILNQSDNDLNVLAKRSIKELMQLKGMGEAKSITIAAALELGRRRKETASTQREKITSPAQVYEVMKPLLLDLPYEEMWLISMNRANQIIKLDKVGAGGVSGVYADVKIILKKAIDNLASAIIVVHNHPSGQLKASTADKTFTANLKAACSFIDITLADHLIFAESGYFSFTDESLLG